MNSGSQARKQFGLRRFHAFCFAKWQGEFGISRRKLFCVLQNEREELCEESGNTNAKKPALGRFNGGRRRIRTSDRSVRSRVLYPAELCVRSTNFLLFYYYHPANVALLKTFVDLDGGRRRIRTSDRSVRSRVLYPAELCVHLNLKQLAEGEGFEPSIEFPLYTLSRGAPSATRPSLRATLRCVY